jgi:hypothetical protein
MVLYNLASGLAQAGPVIAFDAPSAGQGTSAVNINDFGVAIGSFIDDNKVFHGFMRTLNGVITTIDAAGCEFFAQSGPTSMKANIRGLHNRRRTRVPSCLETMFANRERRCDSKNRVGHLRQIE